MSTIRKIPLQDFFKLPEKTAFRIAPNGDYISWLAPYENRQNLHVAPVNDLQTVTRLTSEIDRGIHTYIWGNADTLVYLKDDKGNENFHVFSVNINDPSSCKALTPFPEAKVNIIDRLQHSDTDILISMNQRDPQIFDVYRLNIVDGTLELAAENPGNISSWLADHQGKIRVAQVTDGVSTSILYRDDESEPFRTVISTNFKEEIIPTIFSADNQHVYAISNQGRDKKVLVKIDISKGEEVEILYAHDEVDIYGATYSRKRGELFWLYYVTWKVQNHFFKESDRRHYENMQAAIGEHVEFYLSDWNQDEDLYLLRTLTDKLPGRYYLYDLNTEKTTMLADLKPYIKEEEMASVQPIVYQSRDGETTIHGYLTLPVNSDGKNLPAVIHPHGGPWVRDIWGFNPVLQFLANRGYAVLQMNYRGSTGYGKKFLEKGYKQWGLAMQDDISDGVKWLIEEGIADPKRVAIYGGSYGGYATLAGLTFTPELYACGIDFVGVSNIFTFFQSIPPYWKPFLEMMYEMVGHPEKDAEQLRATSPVFHVENIKAPLFVAQGAQDPRVKKAESDQIVEALRARGVDVQYMVKENEGHGFHNQENRMDFYQAMETFLEKYL